MYIITDKRNTIMYLTETFMKINENVMLVDNGTLNLIIDDAEVYGVNEIPEYVTTIKYCYNETNGFYENPDYVEPEEPVSLESLANEISELRANLDYMSMIANVDLPNIEEI